MTMVGDADTVTRSASAALEQWFPLSVGAAVGPHRRALETERVGVTSAIAGLVARMDQDGADPDLLDDLTEQVVDLLGRAEELRLALALTDRAALDTWLVAIDFD